MGGKGEVSKVLAGREELGEGKGKKEVCRGEGAVEMKGSWLPNALLLPSFPGTFDRSVVDWSGSPGKSSAFTNAATRATEA